MKFVLFILLGILFLEKHAIGPDADNNGNEADPNENNNETSEAIIANDDAAYRNPEQQLQDADTDIEGLQLDTATLNSSSDLHRRNILQMLSTPRACERLGNEILDLVPLLEDLEPLLREQRPENQHKCEELIRQIMLPIMKIPEVRERLVRRISQLLPTLEQSELQLQEQRPENQDGPGEQMENFGVHGTGKGQEEIELTRSDDDNDP